MKPEEVLKTIFQGNPFKDLDEAVGFSFGSSISGIDKSSSLENNLKMANNYVKSFVQTSNSKKDTKGPPPIPKDNREGRIGPGIVIFDKSSYHGSLIISTDKLSLNSQSNFSTMRANVGVFHGKWMYEVQLGTKGVMQLGWGTIKCKFHQESGVGDTVNSYAYDGNRMRKWNVSTYKYGERWFAGDIIGCAVDLDVGSVDFYRNGRHLGRAFENVTLGPGMVYFPTVSLAFSENLTANFGSVPLRFPIQDYQPLQAPPLEEIKRARLYMSWLTRLIQLSKDLRAMDKSNFEDDKSMSLEAFLMCLSRRIFKDLGPLLTDSYVTEAVFIPFIEESLSIAEDSTSDRLNTFMDMLWSFMTEEQMNVLLENAVNYLLSTFRRVTSSLDYPDQRVAIGILIALCRHRRTRQYLLQNVLFDRIKIVNFSHVNPLDDYDLAIIVNKTWWETNPLDSSVEINKKQYIAACEKIKFAISEIESLQVDLLVTLLDNTDGTTKEPASRAIFLKKLRQFVRHDFITSRSDYLQTLSIPQAPLPIALCYFHRLLAAFQVLWRSEVAEEITNIPCRVFYDSSIDYFGTDRFGGVLSHLNKTFRNELTRLLGSDHEEVTRTESQHLPASTSNFPGSPVPVRLEELPLLIPAFARILSMTDGNAAGSPVTLEHLRVQFRDSVLNRDDRRPLKMGILDAETSLLELLDGIIMFYHSTAKEQIAKVAGLRDGMNDYIGALSDAKTHLDSAKRNKDFLSQDMQKELMQSVEVFREKLNEQSRHMAWVRAAIFSEDKQLQLAWLLNIVTSTLRVASEEIVMFVYVPDFYLEALADLSTSLRLHLHPTAPLDRIPNYEGILVNVGEFLCQHFLDPRIVVANAKDTLILLLANFVSNPLTLRALEKVREETRRNLVVNLLKPYENRAWAQSNWILVRFWQGNGFAFRYTKSPQLSMRVGPKLLMRNPMSQPIKPCPSELFQSHVAEVLRSNPEATSQFLNSMLTELNWAFSEFIGMTQEIHNIYSRSDRITIELRQLKVCATCFDLTVYLLRVFEMIAAIAPDVIVDPYHAKKINLLGRLCQLLSQILNRVSSQTSSFHLVLLLDIPDLEAVDHFPILTAVIGILLMLLKDELEEDAVSGKRDVPKVTERLLSETSFQISSLHFGLGNVKSKEPSSKKFKTFSLSNYKDDVSEEEIVQVQRMISHLEYYRDLMPDSLISSEDDNICIICYEHPIVAVFVPCNHQSCKFCIDHHLLTSRECFFCKTIIEKVFDVGGEILHDFTKPEQGNNVSSSS